ncbi:helix-turn-helix domain-containing protein [Chthonobacter rhizosphaerae]|uniref:helix-turn-helix domain-containing protein n=1 Tax=Chthonobacter rhizosphaerae TaxID=2735553 RepID=UPI0015EFC6D2|nr:helix-turn-helix transcriptional regulator [Chthonobacter rhizosphaerae]
MDDATHTLPITLQRARKARRISQLELALRLGVSQRHVSFVESGRSRPSRALLMAWLDEVETPLALRNAAMLQAGYAPAYGDGGADDPALGHARAALTQLLEAHDPMPALVLDADWTVVHANRGGLWLAATLMPWLADMPAGARLNMVDALVRPDGPIRFMTNLAEVGPALLSHLRHEAATHPALTPRVEAFAGALKARLGRQRRPDPPGGCRPLSPVLTTRFATAHGDLAFFSMFTTFGTPQDIGLASLRVEHIFPADEATARIVRAAVAGVTAGAQRE